MSLSLSDQLRPFRERQRISSPLIRHVVSVTAKLGGADKEISVRESRKLVLKWLQSRVGTLPSEAWEGKTFEHMTPGRFAAGVRIKVPNGEYWTVRCDDPDKNVPGRTWTTELSIARQADAASFGVRLVVATNETEPNYVPSIPGIVRQLADEPGLFRNGRKLTTEPLIVDDKQKLEYFIGLLFDRNRRNPVFAISLDEAESNPATAVINPYNLAPRCLGTAHVVVISGPQAFRLSDVIGKRLSVFRRAVRTYLPGMSSDDDPYRHPLAMASQIEDWQGRGADAFASTLIWTATRNSATSIDDTIDLPSFTKVKQIELQQQREIALQERDYPALLALADQELKEKQREIETLESMVTEEEGKRAESDARRDDLQSTNMFLRSRLVALERKISSDSPRNPIVYPKDFEDIESWAEEFFPGKIKIAPRAQRDAKDAEFLDVQLVYGCLEYLATDFWEMKTEGGNDLLEKNAAALARLGVRNESSGADHLLKEQGDTFEVQWGANNRKRLLDMHLKNGGNTRDPARCLRIYYFWDDDTQQVVVGSLPSHLNTRAS